MAKDLEFTAKVAADMSKAARKDDALKKLIDAWNSKNAKTAKRVGTFGFMAAALAACGGGGSGGSGSAGGGNSGGGGNTSSFGVTQVADGETTVSGSFAFFDRTAETITSITADPDDIADKFLVDVDQLDVLDDPVSVAGVTKINLSGGVTLVATIEDLEPLVQVTGSGNVWVLIGTADPNVADHESFELNINITGNLIFDMDGDEREIEGNDVEQKVAVTGTIDLNGGDIIVSDGTVDLTEAELLNIGQTVEINSTLIITYLQFVEALEAETSFAGTGNLVVKMGDTDGDLLEGYLAVAHLLDQVQLQDPADGPKSFILQASGSTQSIEVSPQDIDLTVGRFVDQAIALFEQRIQGFADSGDFTSLARILNDATEDLNGNLVAATTNSIAGLKAALGNSSESNSIAGRLATLEQSLANIQLTPGAGGKSAYQIALDNGFVGTEEQWLASLQGAAGAPGASGADGKSAYQIALDNGFVGTEEQWLASLQGAAGASGADGKSAYQIALDNGFVGTEEQWLASLQGAAGAPGAPGASGADGAGGKSAYQIALDNGFVGTEEQWLASLQGAAGASGADGKSAYQIALDNGFVGTEEQWLASLQGADGAPGAGGTGGSSSTDTYVDGLSPADAEALLVSFNTVTGSEHADIAALKVALNGVYSVTGSASQLVALPPVILNGAFNVTATDDVNSAQANTLMSASNSGTTTLANLVVNSAEAAAIRFDVNDIVTKVTVTGEFVDDTINLKHFPLGTEIVFSGRRGGETVLLPEGVTGDGVDTYNLTVDLSSGAGNDNFVFYGGGDQAPGTLSITLNDSQAETVDGVGFTIGGLAVDLAGVNFGAVENGETLATELAKSPDIATAVYAGDVLTITAAQAGPAGSIAFSGNSALLAGVEDVGEPGTPTATNDKLVVTGSLAFAAGVNKLTLVGTVDFSNVTVTSTIIRFKDVAGKITEGDTFTFTFAGEEWLATVGAIAGDTATAAEIQAAVNAAQKIVPNNPDPHEVFGPGRISVTFETGATNNVLFTSLEAANPFPTAGRFADLDNGGAVTFGFGNFSVVAFTGSASSVAISPQTVSLISGFAGDGTDFEVLNPGTNRKVVDLSYLDLEGVEEIVVGQNVTAAVSLEQAAKTVLRKQPETEPQAGNEGKLVAKLEGPLNTDLDLTSGLFDVILPVTAEVDDEKLFLVSGVTLANNAVLTVSGDDLNNVPVTGTGVVILKGEIGPTTDLSQITGVDIDISDAVFPPGFPSDNFPTTPTGGFTLSATVASEFDPEPTIVTIRGFGDDKKDADLSGIGTVTFLPNPALEVPAGRKLTLTPEQAHDLAVAGPGKVILNTSDLTAPATINLTKISAPIEFGAGTSASIKANVELIVTENQLMASGGLTVDDSTAVVRITEVTGTLDISSKITSTKGGKVIAVLRDQVTTDESANGVDVFFKDVTDFDIPTGGTLNLTAAQATGKATGSENVSVIITDADANTQYDFSGFAPDLSGEVRVTFIDPGNSEVRLKDATVFVSSSPTPAHETNVTFLWPHVIHSLNSMQLTQLNKVNEITLVNTDNIGLIASHFGGDIAAVTTNLVFDLANGDAVMTNAKLNIAADKTLTVTSDSGQLHTLDISGATTFTVGGSGATKGSVIVTGNTQLSLKTVQADGLKITGQGQVKITEIADGDAPDFSKIATAGGLIIEVGFAADGNVLKALAGGSKLPTGIPVTFEASSVEVQVSFDNGTGDSTSGTQAVITVTELATLGTENDVGDVVEIRLSADAFTSGDAKSFTYTIPADGLLAVDGNGNNLFLAELNNSANWGNQTLKGVFSFSGNDLVFTYTETGVQTSPATIAAEVFETSTIDLSAITEPLPNNITLGEHVTLQATAAQLSGKSVTGPGKVEVSGLEAALAADLSGINAAEVEIKADLSSAAEPLTFIGSFSNSVTTSQDVIITSTTAEKTLTLGSSAQVGTASFDVGTNVTLEATGAQLDGRTVTGTGDVILSGVTAAHDLSGIGQGVTVEGLSSGALDESNWKTRTSSGDVATVDDSTGKVILSTMAGSSSLRAAQASIRFDEAGVISFDAVISGATARIELNGANRSPFEGSTSVTFSSSDGTIHVEAGDLLTFSLARNSSSGTDGSATFSNFQFTPRFSDLDVTVVVNEDLDLSEAGLNHVVAFDLDSGAELTLTLEQAAGRKIEGTGSVKIIGGQYAESLDLTGIDPSIDVAVIDPQNSAEQGDIKLTTTGSNLNINIEHADGIEVKGARVSETSFQSANSLVAVHGDVPPGETTIDLSGIRNVQLGFADAGDAKTKFVNANNVDVNGGTLKLHASVLLPTNLNAGRLDQSTSDFADRDQWQGMKIVGDNTGTVVIVGDFAPEYTSDIGMRYIGSELNVVFQENLEGRSFNIGRGRLFIDDGHVDGKIIDAGGSSGAAVEVLNFGDTVDNIDLSSIGVGETRSVGLVAGATSVDKATASIDTSDIVFPKEITVRGLTEFMKGTFATVAELAVALANTLEIDSATVNGDGKTIDIVFVDQSGVDFSVFSKNTFPIQLHLLGYSGAVVFDATKLPSDPFDETGKLLRPGMELYIDARAITNAQTVLRAANTDQNSTEVVTFVTDGTVRVRVRDNEQDLAVDLTGITGMTVADERLIVELIDNMLLSPTADFGTLSVLQISLNRVVGFKLDQLDGVTVLRSSDSNVSEGGIVSIVGAEIDNGPKGDTWDLTKIFTNIDFSGRSLDSRTGFSGNENEYIFIENGNVFAVTRTTNGTTNGTTNVELSLPVLKDYSGSISGLSIGGNNGQNVYFSAIQIADGGMPEFTFENPNSTNWLQVTGNLTGRALVVDNTTDPQTTLTLNLDGFDFGKTYTLTGGLSADLGVIADIGALAIALQGLTEITDAQVTENSITLTFATAPANFTLTQNRVLDLRDLSGLDTDGHSVVKGFRGFDFSEVWNASTSSKTLDVASGQEIILDLATWIDDRFRSNEFRKALSGEGKVSIEYNGGSIIADLSRIANTDTNLLVVQNATFIDQIGGSNQRFTNLNNASVTIGDTSKNVQDGYQASNITLKAKAAHIHGKTVGGDGKLTLYHIDQKLDANLSFVDLSVVTFDVSDTELVNIPLTMNSKPGYLVFTGNFGAEVIDVKDAIGLINIVSNAARSVDITGASGRPDAFDVGANVNLRLLASQIDGIGATTTGTLTIVGLTNTLEGIDLSGVVAAKSGVISVGRVDIELREDVTLVDGAKIGAANLLLKGGFAQEATFVNSASANDAKLTLAGVAATTGLNKLEVGDTLRFSFVAGATNATFNYEVLAGQTIANVVDALNAQNGVWNGGTFPAGAFSVDGNDLVFTYASGSVNPAPRLALNVTREASIDVTNVGTTHPSYWGITDTETVTVANKTTLTLRAAQADGNKVVGDGDVVITMLHETLGADLGRVEPNGPTSEVVIDLSDDAVLTSGATIGNVDLVVSGAHVLDISAIGSANNWGVDITRTITVETGATLRLTAAQADGLEIIGDGKVIISSVEALPNADLSRIASDDIVIEVRTDETVFIGKLPDNSFELVKVDDVAAKPVFDVTGATHAFTGGDDDIVVGENTVLKLTAAQVVYNDLGDPGPSPEDTGPKTITGAGDVIVTSFVDDVTVDLSHVTVSGDVTLERGAENLDKFTVSLANTSVDYVLSGTANEGGDFILEVTDKPTSASIVTGFAAGNTEDAFDQLDFTLLGNFASVEKVASTFSGTTPLDNLSIVILTSNGATNATSLEVNFDRSGVDSIFLNEGSVNDLLGFGQTMIFAVRDDDGDPTTPVFVNFWLWEDTRGQVPGDPADGTVQASELTKLVSLADVQIGGLVADNFVLYTPPPPPEL